MSEVEAILADIQGTTPQGPELTVSTEDHKGDRDNEAPIRPFELNKEHLRDIQEQLDQITQLESVRNFIADRGVISRSMAMESFAGMPFYTLNDKLVTKLTEQPSKIGLNLVTSDIKKYADELERQVAEQIQDHFLKLKSHIELIESKNILDAIRFTLPRPRDEYGGDLTVLCYSIITRNLFNSSDDFYNSSYVQKKLEDKFTDGVNLAYVVEDQDIFFKVLKDRCGEASDRRITQVTYRAFLSIAFTIDLIYRVYNDIQG